MSPAKTKAIWITGASSGIGKAMAEKFVKNGLIVLASARRLDQLEKIKEEIGHSGDGFKPFSLNVKDYKGINKFVEEVSGQCEIDCLINNAGVTSFKPAIENTLAEIEEIINVNLLGSIYAVKSVLPGMLERKRGTIINILSAVTHKVFNNSSAYSASKCGLQAYSKVLREELRDQNIRVINVSPGATATPIWPATVTENYSNIMIHAEDLANLIFDIYSESSNMVAEEILVRPLTGDL